MPKMTDQELAAIELRVRRITPGKWYVSACNRCDTLHVRDAADLDVRYCNEGDWAKPEDRVFLDNAPKDVLALLAEVHRLRSIVDETH